MAKQASKVLGHASIYALGNILRNITSFIMLPIYTRYLTPADYGVIELLNMLLDFVGIILGMRLGEAVFRYYCTEDDDRVKKSVVSTSLFLALVLNGFGVIMVVLLADPISVFLLGDVGLKDYVVLFSLSLLLGAFIELTMTFVRAQQRPWFFISLSMMKLLVQLSLNIYFVVILDMKVEGVIYSALISGGIISTILLIYTLRKVGFRVSKSIAKKITGFSWPLMLASMGAFYMTFGDRYFIRYFGDLEEMGIYSLGYKFGFVLVILTWDPFQKIWDSIKYEILKKENAREIYQRIFIYLSAFMIAGALGISLFVKDLLMVMSDPAFWPAYKMVPIIMIAYLIQSWTAFCYFGILLKGNTIQITYGTVIAVVVISIAYLSLIPYFGAYGAAWATVFGFAARFFWTNAKACQHYDMGLQWGKVSLIFGLAVAIYGASWLIPEVDGLLASIMVHSLLYLTFFAVFILLPVLSKEEKIRLLAILKGPKKLKSSLLGEELK